ncbi:eclosion hormone [Coccinella septempunctata]|uniref:eclosion hormone n=1 Tax=Coccinella septempunctata TaxID=41139 RepID=UPI001D086237|nr:eclosion hormone [Coccinella septempunctata]XP_044756744.1 eclosion hormone [Coccinella septempunctata]XP_044756745.1 eclosion hormone [Coccinella septempunctata]
MLRKIILLVFICCMIVHLEAYNPVTKLSRPIGICIRNCAQCKKMYGPYFDGELCGDACIKFKGKIIPDCDDINSVAPFLTRLD